MPRSHLFYKYLEKCLDRLQKSHNEYFSTGDKPLLFKIRVSIKKTRASIRCLEYYNGLGRYKATRKLLKKIFDLGGELRTYKYYEDWMHRHNLVRLSREIELPERIAKKEKAFSDERVKNHKIIKDIRHQLLKDAKSISQQQVDEYYLVLLDERIDVLFSNASQKKWHAERKEIKRIIYARHWQDQSTLKLISNRQAEFLDRLQHQIGDWNDHDEMVDWVKKQKKEYSSNRNIILNKYFEKALQILNKMQERNLNRVRNSRARSREVLQPFLDRFRTRRNEEAQSTKR